MLVRVFEARRAFSIHYNYNIIVLYWVHCLTQPHSYYVSSTALLFDGLHARSTKRFTHVMQCVIITYIADEGEGWRTENGAVSGS